MARPTSELQIHQAIKSGNYLSVREVLRRDRGAVHYSSAEGWMPLHTAVATHQWHENIVMQILEAGAPVNTGTKNRNASALMLATSFGRISLIAKLLDWGADVDHAANIGWNKDTSLHKAAAMDDPDLVHLLLLRGASVNVKNANSETALDVASRYERQANILILEEFGGTSSRRQKEVISRRSINRSLVLNQNVDAFIEPSGKINLIAGAVWATKQGDSSLVEYILNIDPTVINVYDDDGWELMHFASMRGYIDISKLLLDRGANVDSCTQRRRCTPLHLAAQKGHLSTVKLLLDNGASLSALTRRGSTPYMLALRAEKRYVATCLADYVGQHPRPHEELNHRPPRRTNKVGRRRVSSQQLWEADENDSGDEKERDGRHGHLSAISSGFKERQTFSLLIETWKDRCQLTERDEPIKVAVVDTGFDLKNEDLKRAPIESFYTDNSGNLAARLSKDYPCPQISRIKGGVNFSTEVQRSSDDIQDLDGHGTRVAGIILRLAPAAELYIARVCDGEKAERRGTRRPTCSNVTAAVEWAIRKEVDVINMSLGFPQPDRSLKDMVNRAKEKGIIVLAAMANSSNYSDFFDYPAGDFEVAIGINSCKPGGTYPSEFTSPPVPGSHNFMAAGENIIVHKLSPLSGPGRGTTRPVSERFQLADGTSYATPVVASMVVLILAFVRRSGCSTQRRKLRKNGIDAVSILKNHKALAEVLLKVGKPAIIPPYFWISPKLLWMDFQIPENETGVTNAAKEHAWELIRLALEPYKLHP